MKKSTNSIILTIFLFTAFIFVITALVSLFYSSKAGDIKQEQNRLISENLKLKSSIVRKKEEYEKIADKISEIKSLINQKSKLSSTNIKELLSSLKPETRELIVKSIPSGYPSSSKRVTSIFGYRVHPIEHIKKFHHGIDFGGKIGIEIVATADGIVEFSGQNRGYGNLVVISHNFGFKTAYAHMLQKLMVKKGDFIKKGEVVGYLGNSGISTGPHLHYEVKHIKNILDPKQFLNFTINNFETIFYKEDKIAWDSLVKAILIQYGKFNESLVSAN